MQKNITDSVVVHCIDFRLQGHLDRWLAENVGEGNFDRVALAGAVYEFETVFKQVQIAERLHEIKKVILINHEDCGAYGVEGTEERHTADLIAAQEKVAAQYPDLKIEAFFLYLNGTLEPVTLA